MVKTFAVIMNFSLLFLPASFKWGLSSIITTFTSFYLWPLIFKSSPTVSLIFWLYGRTVVVDSFAGVTCFPNALFKANIATDEVDAVICATRRVAKYLVGFKSVRVGTVLAQKASDIRTCFKTAIYVQLLSHRLRLSHQLQNQTICLEWHLKLKIYNYTKYRCGVGVVFA